MMNALEGDALARLFHDDADEMNDGVASLHSLVEGCGVEERSLDGATGEQRGAVIHQRRDGVAAGDELFEDCGADEAGSAGDEDAMGHGCDLSLFTVQPRLDARS